MSEKKVPVLSDETVALADKFKTVMTIDTKTGIGDLPDTDFYKNNLPDNVDMTHVETISNYNTQYIAAGAKAFGDLAIDAMAENCALKDATLTMKMGVKDEVTFDVNRIHTYKNNFAKEGEASTVTKFGTLSTCYEVKSGSLAGELKAVREQIRDIANVKLAKGC